MTAGNDADTADESVSLTHGATSADSDYEGITIAGVAVTVNDNDTARVMGVTVEPGDAQLVVTWTAVDNATGYKVQWTSGGQDYDTGDRQATVTPGSTTSHTIDSLANGTEYTVRVIATLDRRQRRPAVGGDDGDADRGAGTCTGIAHGRRDSTRSAASRHGRTRAALPRERLSPGSPAGPPEDSDAAVMRV